MTNYLVLGSGLVAGPCVDYLCRQPESHVTVASNLPDEAQALVNGYDNARAVHLDASDEDEMVGLVRAHDVAISLLPPAFHVPVAEACIRGGTHFVSASYETEAMRALAGAAEQAGVGLFNEIGLDPGIDHLGAMQIIDKARADGERITHFVSWCGGLPAPHSNDNPLGYKFSWQPKGAILVLLNTAQFLQDGAPVHVPGKRLMDWARPVVIGAERFACYPNRNSINYREIYGLDGIDTLIRGTLRWPGFCEIMAAAKRLSLFAQSPHEQPSQTSWCDLVKSLNQGQEIADIRQGLSRRARTALDWLGVFSNAPVGPHVTPLDAFCALLLERLSYAPGEQDMIVLSHKFILRRPDGSQRFKQMILRLEGRPGGPSAMARTVGLPAAMAARLLGEGQLQKTGLILPVSPDIYTPMLNWLAAEGICFEEQAFGPDEMSTQTFLVELAEP
ncbi:MAG TPA: saccharopine dehydrogenase [Hellea balneolensis]|uniref:Saccharopine dehydrogenase n=1 Tax=Hellea balneolensis TaxID=287478 RepID=A0A7V5NW58_9PROT|nr:saccharopine dehydrogenase [Hellea balneolensis]